MLTELERRILNFIGEYLRENEGRAPTLSEIGEGCGVNSVGTVHRYVSSIEDKGFLNKAGKGWRTRLAPNELPFRGKIAAGRPIEAIEDAESIDVGALVLQPDCFTLRVEGDSMIECGILDGDLVIVKPSQTAKNGQIVVALVNNEATLKEFKRIDGGRRIELISHNKEHRSQIYASDAVEIQGILQTVVRTYSSS
ncbi:transcriptional repressor LexA [Hyphomicrobium sp.]|uniref:transcriptional repressor LexA n=1 Tax=Hyphomicrobium sp. TaxID=82 RepID=UPI001D857D79|nr:transcriptional repressor LexA [Hyphomicrobium sp.]MBY0559140.1 transcriptional repressor LexA [Hyphomicrobium sp.]